MLQQQKLFSKVVVTKLAFLFLADIIDKLIKTIHPDYYLNAEEEKKWREYVSYHSSLIV